MKRSLSSSLWLLHHAIMAPRPAGSKSEFLDAGRGGIWIVKSLGREDDPQFAQKFFECGISVSERRKFDTVSIHIEDGGLFSCDDELSQRPQIAQLTTEKLDQFMRIFDRA